MTNKVEAFCVGCRKPVVMKSTKEKTVRDKAAYVGTCPDCKGPVMVYKADAEYLAAEKKLCTKCRSELLASDSKCQFCGMEEDNASAGGAGKSKTSEKGRRKR